MERKYVVVAESHTILDKSKAEATASRKLRPTISACKTVVLPARSLLAAAEC
jgi:hypothetical protein